MSINATTLLSRLRPVLTRLEADLLERSADPGVQAALTAEHTRETEAGRSADPLEVWTRFRVTQIAAAWVLSLLFVRTLEDRGLVPLRLKKSEDHREQLRALAPYLTDRDYLLLVFQELTRYHGIRDVFDAAHNPVWTLAPSADVAAELLAFARSENGLGSLDFSGDTRFLGDVYEQLDEGVRKRFALLQTPDFVEEFILDRTLTPALDARGVQGLTLIDPTCGSGHFLLGAFARLFAEWKRAMPHLGAEAWAMRAVEQVYGVDINPYAVAIARFRLVLAYADAAEIRSMSEANDLRLNLAVADSLLPVQGANQLHLATGTSASVVQQFSASPFAFAQSPEAIRVLGGRTFDVVVGNPPYITVKDKALRDAYREIYTSAYREYQLVVPFVERFFRLANAEGWVGAIVGNGFMKRLFGQRLIQDYLPTVDLTQIIDTSGAFIPGHGTPTVILFGRHRPAKSNTVLTTMGKRGEPTTPAVPAEGQVWASIRDHSEEVEFENDYISVDLLKRDQLSTHPWSLKGGGALQVKQLIEDRSAHTLNSISQAIGFTAITRADDLYFIGRNNGSRLGLSPTETIPLVEGDRVRDWAISDANEAVFPFDSLGTPVSIEDRPALHRFLWPHREHLWLRREPNGNHRERQVTWWEWSRFHPERLNGEFLFTFAFVATHNHFVLDRGGKVFKQSAPIIKLPPEATEDDHLALLGYLNSSTACFWMKQVMHNKHGSGDGKGMREAWMDRYEFDSTKIAMTPLPEDLTQCKAYASIAVQLVETSQQYKPESQLTGNWRDSDSLRLALDTAKQAANRVQAKLIAVQEELDWHVYELFGLCETGQAMTPREVGNAQIQPGQRAFEAEIDPNESDWFSLQGWSKTALMEPSLLTERIKERQALIAKSRSLALLERPNFKRRWYALDHAALEQAALSTWLLDQIEAHVSAQTEPVTVRQLARALSRNPKVLAVAEVYANHPDPDLERLFSELVKIDAVPYVAAYRYKEKGIEKYRAWQRTWAGQRREDAGETGVKVPLPPKYGSGDFARPEYWKLRGKLDVPKERFIAYPGCEDTDDSTAVLGWAGWDHADRIAALGHLIEQAETDEQRTPLLAGMLELLPWVQQWHEHDNRFGTPLGPMWRRHLEGLLTNQHLTEAHLRAWRPATKSGGKSSGSSSKKTRAPRLTRSQLEEAFGVLFEDNPNGVERRQLEEALSTSGAQIKKVAQKLLDEGLWVEVKSRPVTYALAGAS